ncbi:hypothetical protein BDF19DRAFT_436198 [Syncephalis fuscata]|nr:hypothetical protein BDF19DRAFT_436198 [Syncephalis fuscata]
MGDNTADAANLVLNNMASVAKVFSGARTVLSEFQQTVQQMQETDKMHRTSTAITVSNQHQHLQLIDGAYVTSTGLCDPPINLFINTGETQRWVFNSSVLKFSTKGCVIYEVRDLKNGLGSDFEELVNSDSDDYDTAKTAANDEKRLPTQKERVFIVAGAWAGLWKRSRMMLGVFRTTDNFALTSDPGRQGAYKAIKGEFYPPGARLRVGGRLGSEGFSVTAQMNENNPARMTVVLEHWDCCDTEEGGYVATRARGENDVTFAKYTPPTLQTPLFVRPRNYISKEDDEEEEEEKEEEEEVVEKVEKEEKKDAAPTGDAEPTFSSIGDATQAILDVVGGLGDNNKPEDEKAEQKE